ARFGQDARVAGLVRLHLDVVPARGALGPEVDAAAREVGGGCEAGVHLRVLPDDDAAHGLVLDLHALRLRRRRGEPGHEDSRDDDASAHPGSWRISEFPMAWARPSAGSYRSGGPRERRPAHVRRYCFWKVKTTRSPLSPRERNVTQLDAIATTSPATTWRLPGTTDCAFMTSKRHSPPLPVPSTSTASTRFSPSTREAVPYARPRPGNDAAAPLMTTCRRPPSTPRSLDQGVVSERRRGGSALPDETSNGVAEAVALLQEVDATAKTL